MQTKRTTTIAEDNHPVAGNIERILDEKGIKGTKIASLFGWPRSALSDRLHGRRTFKAREILIISKHLGVDVSELFKEGEEKPNEAQ